MVSLQKFNQICLILISGTNAPITAYDKNGVKVILHFAKDSPRPDITVMVVSVMSTNTSPVAGFVFQAAVPKVWTLHR